MHGALVGRRHELPRRNRQQPPGDHGRRPRRRRAQPRAAAMEMVLLGTGGCTAYDVVVILKKSGQDVTGCEVKLDAERAATDPEGLHQDPHALRRCAAARLKTQPGRARGPPFAREVLLGHRDARQDRRNHARLRGHRSVRRFVLFLMLMGVAAAAAAQVRTIPKEAQRGEIRHLQDMNVEMNGKPLRLSPGAQIRDADNRLMLPTSLVEKSDVRFLARRRRPGAPRVDPDAARANAGAAEAVAGRNASRGTNEEALPAHLRLPDERVRLGEDRRRARASRGLRAAPRARGRRRDRVQHLLGAREGAGEGVRRPRPRQAPEARATRADDRRRRLRREPGRRARSSSARPTSTWCSARRRCTACRSCSSGAARAAGRRSTSAFPRSRSSTTCRRRASTGAARFRLDHGRLQQVLQLLRRAVHARRGSLAPVRRRGRRDRRPRARRA